MWSYGNAKLSSKFNPRGQSAWSVVSGGVLCAIDTISDHSVGRDSSSTIACIFGGRPTKPTYKGYNLLDKNWSCDCPDEATLGYVYE